MEKYTHRMACEGIRQETVAGQKWGILQFEDPCASQGILNYNKESASPIAARIVFQGPPRFCSCIRGGVDYSGSKVFLEAKSFTRETFGIVSSGMPSLSPPAISHAAFKSAPPYRMPSDCAKGRGGGGDERTVERERGGQGAGKEGSRASAHLPKTISTGDERLVLLKVTAVACDAPQSTSISRAITANNVECSILLLVQSQ